MINPHILNTNLHNRSSSSTSETSCILWTLQKKKLNCLSHLTHATVFKKKEKKTQLFILLTSYEYNQHNKPQMSYKNVKLLFCVHHFELFLTSLTSDCGFPFKTSGNPAEQQRLIHSHTKWLASWWLTRIVVNIFKTAPHHFTRSDTEPRLSACRVGRRKIKKYPARFWVFF